MGETLWQSVAIGHVNADAYTPRVAAACTHAARRARGHRIAGAVLRRLSCPLPGTLYVCGIIVAGRRVQ